MFNYSVSHSDLFPRRLSRSSFFWKGVISCVLALRACISHEIRSGRETFFWKDPWLNGVAPRYIWPESYGNSRQQNGTVLDCAHMLTTATYLEYAGIQCYADRLNRDSEGEMDVKTWKLTKNGDFSVKSFYTFLIDGGLRCPVAKFFYRNKYPKKINLFNWLA